MKYALALFCVAALSAGQLLFKLSANYASKAPAGFLSHALIPLAGALLIYAVSSAVWVWILQRAELGSLYPIMALAFVFVPLGSYLAFDERFNQQYVLGGILIMAGIVISAWP
ncbi:hypothetical protein [Aestuariivirga sp.]|uniref:hypothetical protein n=1 Tax=Aestuariivirga sp. TaxID=2650926 RepID=UPI003BADA709